MAKTTNTDTIDRRLIDILRALMEKLAGAQSIFLVDLNTAKFLSSYPQNESQKDEFIGVICGSNVYQFEAQASNLKNSLYVVEMELQTEEGKQVFVTRVSPSILLCVVGTRELKTGLAIRLYEDNVKDDILELLENMGIRVSRNK